MLQRLRSPYTWLILAIVAIGLILVFGGWKAVGAMLAAGAAAVAAKNAGTLKKQADPLREGAVREAEAQKARLEKAAEIEAKAAENAKAAEENAAKAAALNKELDALKKKHGLLPCILIGLLLVGLFAGVARAGETALPPDHASLAKMYQEALAVIEDLRADLAKAVEIADQYRQVYETEKQLRENEQKLREEESRLRQEAEAAVARGQEREAKLQAIIDQQAATIAQQQAVIERQNETIKSLARNSLIATILGFLAGGLAGR